MCSLKARLVIYVTKQERTVSENNTTPENKFYADHLGIPT